MTQESTTTRIPGGLDFRHRRKHKRASIGAFVTARKARGLKQTIKVIIASGYASNGRVRETLQAGAAGFIGKPYRLKHMLEMVREILDQ